MFFGVYDLPVLFVSGKSGFFRRGWLRLEMMRARYISLSVGGVGAVFATFTTLSGYLA